MVQRKLGPQADLAKGLASQLKPSSSLQEGNKSMRSADFKKIKKSRSMKLSNIEACKSSSPKKHDPELLPNYMKATSSSVAKQPQVSPNIKKHGSGSCNKPTRTLTKSSSLKSVRTLTKSPSFKLSRASSSAKKKRSGVALCADIDMQRATCSSTLKDSKFPDFLELNHGGTSMVKVCPYLYCSLNGHHHKPSPPPLKMFLKAKRRVLKTQKSSKKIEAIEIYVKNKVVDDDDEDGQVAESLSDGSPKSEIDFEEGFEEIKVEDEDEETQMGLAGEDCFESEYEGEFEASMDEDEDEDEETQMGRFCFESETEGDFEASMDVDGGDSDVIGVDKGAIFSIEIDDLSYLKIGFSMESKDIDEQSGDTAMEETTPASEEIAVPQEGPQLEDDEASNGEEESEAALDHEQETELEAIDEAAQDDPQHEDEESEGALDHHHHHEQETELEAIDEVVELISSDGAMDHQQETELEDLDEGALDHHQEAELEAIDEVSEPISSDGALDHHQEAELEAIDEVSEPISSEGALDHQQETELEAKDEVAELITTDHGALDHHQQETESEAIDEVAELISSDGALDHHQETEFEAIDEVTELISSDGALDHQQETESEAKDEEAQKLKGGFARAQSTNESPLNTDCNTKWSIGKKRSMEESEEESEFNPREPNFLPLIPDPETEKVDLRHQIIDERKNSDEWMLDYALQRTVTKLAPARKRKVALLVEAFESVLPVPRYHHQPPAAAFAHARPIQACN